MRKAWIAISLAPVLTVVGCSQDPEPDLTTPGPPPYDDTAQYEPVEIQEPIDSGAGFGQVSSEPAVQPLTIPQARTYIVQKGDTLWSIAARTYGDGQRWVDIAQLNPTLDPSRMAVGQEITLP